MLYDWNFNIFAPYWPAFLRGVLVTIEISVVSALIGTLGGVALGAFYRVIPSFLQKIALFFNDVLRAIPILVLLFFFFFFPYEDILRIKPPSPLVCSILALGLSQVVFTADLVYAAVEGVPQRTIQGARSLGLRETAIWRYIILPDIIRQILPTLIAFWIGILKLSNLASVIGVQEVVFVAQVASAQEFRSLEAWVIVAVIYIILVLPLTLVARRFEKSEWLKRRS